MSSGFLDILCLFLRTGQSQPGEVPENEGDLWQAQRGARGSLEKCKSIHVCVLFAQCVLTVGRNIRTSMYVWHLHNICY